MLKKPTLKTRHRSELPVAPMSEADALARLRMYLLWHHPTVQPEDLEPTATPGYWRTRVACSGRDGCDHPMHTALLSEDGVHHTIQFAEYGRRENGKFVAPHRAWQTLRDAHTAAQEVAAA